MAPKLAHFPEVKELAASPRRSLLRWRWFRSKAQAERRLGEKLVECRSRSC
jgi:hypothetical protein